MGMGFSLEVVNAVALQPTEGVLVVTGHLFFPFLISCCGEFSWFCNFDAVMIGTFCFQIWVLLLAMLSHFSITVCSRNLLVPCLLGEM